MSKICRFRSSHRPGCGSRRRRGELHGAPGRDLGPGGRIGLAERASPVSHCCACCRQTTREDYPRQDPCSRAKTSLQKSRIRNARDPRHEDLDDPAGLADLAQSCVHDRRSGRRRRSHCIRAFAVPRCASASSTALQRVRIPDADAHLGDYPHALSGGMRQRVAGAIALACTSDAAHRGRADNRTGRDRAGAVLAVAEGASSGIRSMSMIFVTHDFGVVAKMCDRVAVMYAGRIVETAPHARNLRQPSPSVYAGAAQVSSAHRRSARMISCSIEGQPPDLGAPPPGCRFAPRCPMAIEACREYPDERSVTAGHRVSCWRASRPGPLRSDRADGVCAFRMMTATSELTGWARAVRYAAARRSDRSAAAAKALSDSHRLCSVHENRDQGGRRHRFHRAHGETFGLVGESGCGKIDHVAAPAAAGNSRPRETVRFNGKDIQRAYSRRDLRALPAQRSRRCSRIRPAPSVRACACRRSWGSR